MGNAACSNSFFLFSGTGSIKEVLRNFLETLLVICYTTCKFTDNMRFIGKDNYLSDTIEIHPSENSDWRKHKNACPFYRERWFPGNDAAAGEPMYQVFCMKGTPPLTWEEQDRCLHSKTSCWRLAEGKKKASEAQTGKTEPVGSSESATAV